MFPEFTPFPKIARLSREVIITEKIDGTNACIFIPETDRAWPIARKVVAGSRSRWIEPGDDNFGFAAWVDKNWEQLLELGPGTHFGEWWGKGIQRGYGVPDKRFSLFNVRRWATNRPACCGVVPELYRGAFDTDAISSVLTGLRLGGSVAAPGFMDPEGIVVFHTAANLCFKKTIHKDEEPKGKGG